VRPGPDNPPAFPVSVQPDFQFAEPGMTLWDHFAGQALSGYLAGRCEPGSTPEAGDAARFAAQFADAMMAERKRRAGQ
jgi:hypothetical protein